MNGQGVLTLTPSEQSKQVGTQATVTAFVTNQFGQPVQGANVDFRVVSGPSTGLTQADAVTNVNGRATFAYSSAVQGTDVIIACSESGGSENDTCGAGEPSDVAQVAWVA